MRLALFDFDGTLTRRDTLMPFLRYYAGTAHFVKGLAQLSPQLLAYALRFRRNDVTKESVLRHFFQGAPIGDLHRTGREFASEILPSLTRASLMDRLQKHRSDGDTCVLVSASLDVYVAPWAATQGFDAVLCSSLEVQGSIATGRLHGLNCYGAEKVTRIKTWLGDQKPMKVIAYGDSRGDREMLALADEAYYRGRLTKRDG